LNKGSSWQAGIGESRRGDVPTFGELCTKERIETGFSRSKEETQYFKGETINENTRQKRERGTNSVKNFGEGESFLGKKITCFTPENGKMKGCIAKGRGSSTGGKGAKNLEDRTDTCLKGERKEKF